MRKLAALFAVALGLGAVSFTAGSASADTVCPAGDDNCTTVNSAAYLLVLDGDADNPDPADGFISVSQAGKVCADDNGTADDGNAANGAESDSPTCVG